MPCLSIPQVLLEFQSLALQPYLAKTITKLLLEVLTKQVNAVCDLDVPAAQVLLVYKPFAQVHGRLSSLERHPAQYLRPGAAESQVSVRARRRTWNQG